MRLFFPGGEHQEIELKTGETRLGVTSDGAPVVATEVTEASAISLFRGPLGLWLHVPGDGPPCHVNGRPVRELALLHQGDQIVLEGLRMVLKSDRVPSLEKSATQLPARDDAAVRASAAIRHVLRGICGVHSGEAITVAEDLVVGSAPDARIRVDNPSLPARWLRVKRVPGGLTVRTTVPGIEFEVNGWRVETATLRQGDQLVFDAQRFLVELPAPVPDPAQMPDPHGEMPDDGEPESAPARPGLAAAGLLLAAALIAAVITLLLV